MMAVNKQEFRNIITAEDKSERVFRRAQTNIRKFEKAAVLAGAAIGAAGFLKLAHDTVAVTAEFQKLEKSLITVTGSQEAANDKFKELTALSQKLPSQLEDVVGAFIKMKALGLDPSEAAIISYSNTAAAMGKDLNQMVEAVADASTFEFERLKEFGIKARQQGDEVSFTFQGVTTTVKKNADAISGYLQSIGDTQFAGAAIEQMDTISGAFSNLQVAYKTMLFEMGRGEVGDTLIKSMNDLATAISDPAFVKAMADFASGAAMLAKGGIEFITDEAQRVGNIGGLAGLYASGQISLWDWMTANPEDAARLIKEFEINQPGHRQAMPPRPGGSSAPASGDGSATPEVVDATLQNTDPTGVMGSIAALRAAERQAQIDADIVAGEAMIDTWLMVENARNAIATSGVDQRNMERQREMEFDQLLVDSKRATTDALLGLMQQLGGKSKAWALAGLALSKGVAIADIFMSTQAAAAAALAPPPLGLGPIAGAPIAVGIEASGYTRMGLVAATGLLQAAQIAGGSASGGTGGGTATSPIVTQPTDRLQPQGGGQTLTVQIQGNVIGEDEWVANNLIPTLSEQLSKRNVTVEFA